MELDSVSSNSSDDNDEDIIMLLNSTIIIAGNCIESESTDSSVSENNWGGSPKGKARNIPRNFEGAYNILIHHYFSGDKSLYNETTFEQRFGVPLPIINRLWEEYEGIETFVQKMDRATKSLGVRPFVRFLSVISQIKYGDCADRVDEYLHLSETVANEEFKGS